MEREPRPRTLKLADAASEDYPAASEILVSFPDRWELVQPMSLGDTLLYVAAMPPSQERARCNRFHGLAPEVNLELNTYRLYSFFQPWPIPSVIVSWDEATGTGWVERVADLKMQLRPVGQAQIWKGPTCGVLWECYFHETRRRAANWQDELYQFWRAVEEDMGVARIFTQPRAVPTTRVWWCQTSAFSPLFLDPQSPASASPPRSSCARPARPPARR
jgi:hypothetical protein